MPITRRGHPERLRLRGPAEGPQRRLHRGRHRRPGQTRLPRRLRGAGRRGRGQAARRHGEGRPRGVPAGGEGAHRGRSEGRPGGRRVGRGHALGRRLRRALAHRLQDAGRPGLGVGGQGAAGPHRGLAAEHHQPPRPGREGRRRRRRRRRGRGGRARRCARTSACSPSGSAHSSPTPPAAGTTEVTLPESLTTYRIMAVAGGQGVAVRRAASARSGSASRCCCAPPSRASWPSATPRASAPCCTTS